MEPAPRSAERYKSLFERATENPAPLLYQTDLAIDPEPRNLVDVPTGLGKTAAAVLAWIWRRRFADPDVRAGTPRRLVYCLPMRVIVEQTFAETVKWLARLGLLAGEAVWVEPGANGLPTKQSRLQSYLPAAEASKVAGWAAANADCGDHPIAVHILLGGEERTDWALWPERDAILIGTQDMLLSRALNRGYAAGRARWPLEFGLLNNDCLWVFDEVQLMDTGLATSLQIDAWHDSLLLRPTSADFPKPVPNHGSKPCSSLWMSATMAPHWLEKAVDWAPRAAKEWQRRVRLSPQEVSDDKLRSSQLFKVPKRLAPEPVAVLEKPKTKDNKADKSDAERKQSAYLVQFAAHVRANHAPSGLTLVIVNTVDRATRLYQLLKDQPSLAQVAVRLMHSRFRPMEREGWRDFLNRRDPAPRILVSTQVVEAGVDLSAAVLYTELAPWASLIQRFGRCARYPGESGIVYWLDLDLGSEKQPVDHWSKPYDRTELIAAREALASLKDVGLKSLVAIKDRLTAESSRALFPYEPRFVPRKKDLFDLFDTTPDLTGADVDISRFIRDGVELDVQIFWRDIPASNKPDKSTRPQRRELCSVPCYLFQQSLARLIKPERRIWRRNYRKGWEQVYSRDVDRIYPGQVYLLESPCGGYHPLLGWTGDADHADFNLLGPTTPSKEIVQDDEEDADDLSQVIQWLTILRHTYDVCFKLDEILRAIDIRESDKKILRLAARWHDRGKAHHVFWSKLNQEMLAADDIQRRLAGEPAAKAPDEAWSEHGSRRGFRHELASALAILETLCSAQPAHQAFAWPDGLERAGFAARCAEMTERDGEGDQLVRELAALSADELDLLIYLVAAHHGKVRMSIRSSPDDDRTDMVDPCPPNKRQARGVRDGDPLPTCQIPSSDLKGGTKAPEVSLSLDLIELGLSTRYGLSWRERMQSVLERIGPFRLAYLEGLLRAADCRASIDEDRSAGPEKEG